MGIAGLGLDDNGLLSLTFGDVLVTVGYSESPIEQVSVYVDLGAIPDDRKGIADLLLEVNLQSWLQQCMTIGLDPGGARVVGWNLVPLVELKAPALEAVLRTMLQAAPGIRSMLETPGPSSGAADSPKGSVHRGTAVKA